MQKEITVVDDLLDEKGHLKHAGYSKKMLLKYSRKAIKANKFRIKEWDYYCVYNNKYGVCLTISDNSYLGLMGVTLLDFEQKKEITKNFIIPFTMGKLNFPSSSLNGDVSFTNKDIDISFKNDGKSRFLHCHVNDFKDHKPFNVNVELSDEPKDSIVMHTPYKEDKKAFYYNQKINCLKAHGFASFEDKTFLFTKEDTLGVLDWGRGVWTYSNTWYWSSASGYIDNHLFGFNLGYGFGDASNASENIVFYDGVASKLDKVVFNIPCKDNKLDFMGKWFFTSNDERLYLEFTPILNRKAYTSVVLIESDQNQVFGRFNGYVILDNQEKIEIKDFLGFAEKVKNRW